ncbi:MAG: redox-sensing transcriptional repressor Rex [Saccharofermentans sp.]|nr:redox-sensing transcriptional repressor Rex [Saccharofermentans sp.]
MEKTSVSKATFGRLPEYLRMLREISPETVPYISATTIAKKLNLGEVQVRKDLASVSGAGKPKLGYETVELIEKIEQCLGCDKLTPAVLIGAGKLGRALLHFSEFEKYGVKIIAAFDQNEETINFGGKTEILPMARFDQFCKDKQIRLGIITVGEGSAQEVCNQMVKAGITAIWNFAPCRLNVPSGVVLQNENLALSLAHLNSQL